uniref:Protein Nef n=1 Tax=Human immunodeficiency virus type 1 TaxID=11676 RepID=A0A3S5GPZ3_HV1|nr:nef protein [Human immunodeficiency virus 1]
MGGKWSKHSKAAEWERVREKMKQTPSAAEGVGAVSQTPSAAEGVGAVSQDLAKHGAVTSSNINNADSVWLRAQEEDDEEVGFPVRPQVPLRPMTYKGAFDLSFFLKEKGGLEGMIYSQKRKDILDLWVYHTQGYFPDWHNYTPGPGTRFPLCFGWLFKLVPVDPKEVEEDNKGENNCLLHPMSQHGADDPEGEVLMWKFDSSLGRVHRARQMHPEYYKD